MDSSINYIAMISRLIDNNEDNGFLIRFVAKIPGTMFKLSSSVVLYYYRLV